MIARPPTTDHQHEPLDDAALWLAERVSDQSAVHECRLRFGLTSEQLIEVMAAAQRIRRACMEGAAHDSTR